MFQYNRNKECKTEGFTSLKRCLSMSTEYRYVERCLKDLRPINNIFDCTIIEKRKLFSASFAQTMRLSCETRRTSEY